MVKEEPIALKHLNLVFKRINICANSYHGVQWLQLTGPAIEIALMMAVRLPAVLAAVFQMPPLILATLLMLVPAVIMFDPLVLLHPLTLLRRFRMFAAGVR